MGTTFCYRVWRTRRGGGGLEWGRRGFPTTWVQFVCHALSTLLTPESLVMSKLKTPKVAHCTSTSAWFEWIKRDLPSMKSSMCCSACKRLQLLFPSLSMPLSFGVFLYYIYIFKNNLKIIFYSSLFSHIFLFFLHTTTHNRILPPPPQQQQQQQQCLSVLRWAKWMKEKLLKELSWSFNQ